MTELDKLTSSTKSTWNMLGMMILTYGIYQFLWIMKNRRGFNSFSKDKVSEWNVYLVVTVFVWTLILQLSTPTPEEDLAASTIMSLIGFVLQITLAVMIYLFVTSKIILGLAENIRDNPKNSDIKFNRFFAFLFQCLYINFKLKQIAERQGDSGSVGITESADIPMEQRRYFISIDASSDDSREVSEHELYSLYRSGSLTAETLIWTEGWAEWRTCESFFGK